MMTPFNLVGPKKSHRHHPERDLPDQVHVYGLPGTSV